MDQVGRLLVELAADEEYLGPLIAEMPAESAGGKWLVKPDRGPRLVLFHRPEGVMAAGASARNSNTSPRQTTGVRRYTPGRVCA